MDVKVGAVEFRPARVPDEMEIARQLFVEYQNWLDVDL
jgi:hypothetical protein|tara:strand:+ start:483 stop:596 length:114 start_codon:yes stop_codon:yes gene_type:complete